MKDHPDTLNIFPSQQELVEHLAKKICMLLDDAVRERGRASLVVSGGTTPKPLFERLAEQDIPWNKVTITLADERWVDPSLPESNENLVRTYLLKSRASDAAFVSMKNEAPTVQEGQGKCNALLEHIPRPFDVVILGMGNDGHTASLFPGSSILQEAVEPSKLLCLAVTDSKTAYDRMTLTVPALLDSRQIFIHITGKEKLSVIEQAMLDGPVAKIPIRAILKQKQPPVKIYWAS